MVDHHALDGVCAPLANLQAPLGECEVHCGGAVDLLECDGERARPPRSRARSSGRGWTRRQAGAERSRLAWPSHRPGRATSFSGDASKVRTGSESSWVADHRGAPPVFWLPAHPAAACAATTPAAAATNCLLVILMRVLSCGACDVLDSTRACAFDACRRSLALIARSHSWRERYVPSRPAAHPVLCATVAPLIEARGREGVREPAGVECARRQPRRTRPSGMTLGWACGRHPRDCLQWPFARPQIPAGALSIGDA